MEPETKAVGNLGASRQRIDHPRIGGAGGSADHHRRAARGPIARHGVAQRTPVHATLPIGCHKANGGAADPRLMRDFEPGEVAVAGDVEPRRPVEGTRSFARKPRVRAGQGAEQRRVVGLRSAGREMAGGARRKTRTPGDGANHMRLEFDRDRGSGRRGQLRIERRRDPVGTLGRKGGGRVEQPEIARMREVDDALLQLRDRPPQHVLERLRRREIECREFAPEPGEVDRRDHRTGDDPLVGPNQFAREKVVQLLASSRGREQGPDPARRVCHPDRPPPALAVRNRRADLGSPRSGRECGAVAAICACRHIGQPSAVNRDRRSRRGTRRTDKRDRGVFRQEVGAAVLERALPQQGQRRRRLPTEIAARHCRIIVPLPDEKAPDIPAIFARQGVRLIFGVALKIDEQAPLLPDEQIGPGLLGAGQEAVAAGRPRPPPAPRCSGNARPAS